MPTAPAAARLARTADWLTGSRLILAVVIGVLAAERALDAAALALGLAWVTDSLDGRLARRTPVPTKLGDYDMAVDTFVGAMLVAGVGIGGSIPAWISIAALLLFGLGYLALRQPALSMALQGVGYGALLWRLWTARQPTLWVLVAVIAAIAAIDARKFVRVVLPEFFRGSVDSLRLRRADRSGWPED